MRNKKLLTMSLVVALAFTACGKKETTEPTPAPTETVVESEANGEEITEEGTEEVAEEGTEEAVEEGTEEVTEESGEVASNETLDQIHEAVKNFFGEEYIPSMPYPAQSIEEVFGVNADWYDAAIAEGPMMSVHVDKFIAIHATEGNLENVQNALNNYRETILADTMQYPMNLNKIQGCVVETVGDYVFFVMLGSIDEMAYTEESEMIEAYQAINNEVMDLVKGIIAE